MSEEKNVKIEEEWFREGGLGIKRTTLGLTGAWWEVIVPVDEVQAGTVTRLITVSDLNEAIAGDIRCCGGGRRAGM